MAEKEREKGWKNGENQKGMKIYIRKKKRKNLSPEMGKSFK